MRRAVITLALFLTLAQPLGGQPPARLQVTAGLTGVAATETVDGTGLGWLLGTMWHATDWLGVSVELSRGSRRERVEFLDLEEDALAVLGGPQLTRSVGALRPYARMLVGATRLDLRARSKSPVTSRATFDETHPTFLLGGGVDYPLGTRWAARLGYDYRWVRAPDAFGQHWLSAAAVLRFTP